jgi:ERCC4-type nuclease
MTWRYAALAFLTLALVTLTHTTVRTSRLFSTPRSAVSSSSTSDPESALACGKKISLSCADLSSLELIPGVSGATARNLLDTRTLILSVAKTGSPILALEHARGVGKKTAIKLAQFISLDPDRTCAPEYRPFEPHQRPLPPRPLHDRTTGEAINQ